MKKQDQERQDAINTLRKIVKPGDTVYTALRSVAKSGMSRTLDVYVIVDGEPRWITGLVGKAIGTPQSRKDWENSNGLRVHGCGMDAGFEVIYNLSYYLYPDGFTCVGERCPSNEHSNGDRDYTPHHHKEAGYALRHRWM